ncbi:MULTISPECIES: YlbF family regulator [Enterococcus]|uniref:YlbF family regulator n=1 Tax=Candidatus Enterococcus ferrettii TaxID=2815324 RepID=A0ABV0EQ86_9ENTE|nr:YlbF family regulator [Enterococcus sp. 665A]MBO1341320.1 YlbF family regulator [Enterococcus sp. 665A]
MIIDEALFSLEDQTHRLIDCVKTSQVFKNYLAKKQQMDSCPEVKRLKQEFLREKERFERVADYGDFAPDYLEKQKSARRAKRALDFNENVAQFRVAETDLQTLLDEISQTLAQTVSPEIKVDAGNPFFETGNHHCKGNCHG